VILRGDKTWPFVAKLVGTIVVDNVVATWFGGDLDPQDDGQTSCGYPTKGHPDLIGCSLPMDLGTVKQTDGSPLPRLPWGLHSDGTPNPDGTIVTVWPIGFSDFFLPCPLIDDGPGKQATTNPAEPHGIDLTVAAFVAIAAVLGLDRRTALSRGKLRVGYRITAT
jgi:hypothetical protein